MRSKKIIMMAAVVFSLLIFFSSTAFAQDIPVTINLQTAIDRAVKQNSDLKLADDKIKIAKERLTEIGIDLDRKKKQKEIDDLVWKRADDEKNIKINVTNLYYQVLMNKKQVELQNKVIDRLNGEYEAKNTEIKVGKDIQSSLMQYSMNLIDAKAQLIDMQQKLDSSIMDLNIIMGDKIDQKITLNDENIPEDTISITDIDSIAKMLTEKSHSVLTLLKENEITAQEEHGTPAESDDALKEQLASLKYQIEDEKASIESQARTDYNNILNLKDAMDSKKLNFDLNTNLAKAAKIKLDRGMISSLVYDKAVQQAESVQYAYMQSKLDYYIAIQKYKKFIELAVVK